MGGEGAPVEVDAVAGAVGGDGVAVLHLERFGHVGFQTETVNLQISRVGTGGEKVDMDVVRAMRCDRQGVRLGEPGDFHPRRDAAAGGQVGFREVDPAGRNQRGEFRDRVQVLAGCLLRSIDPSAAPWMMRRLDLIKSVGWLVLDNASLHHAIIKSIVDHGYAPTVDELARRFDCASGDAAGALQRLADDHGVVLHPNSARIWVAHPFSLAPTVFVVRQGERDWWGNCAWCSLGIAALLGGAVTITTALGADGRQVTLHVKDGAVEETEFLIHFPVPMAQVWDNVVYACSTMLVFETEVGIDAWCARHRIAKGDVQPIAKVAIFAAEWYGRHLDKDWQKWTAE